MAQNFTKETCMPNGRILLSVDLLGPYWGYVLAILGPYFGYFCNIYAFRCLKWFKFSLKSHVCHIDEYSLILNY